VRCVIDLLLPLLHLQLTRCSCLQGFLRVRSVLAEEALDYGPRARDVFIRMMQAGTKQGWLSLDPES